MTGLCIAGTPRTADPDTPDKVKVIGLNLALSLYDMRPQFEGTAVHAKVTCKTGPMGPYV